MTEFMQVYAYMAALRLVTVLLVRGHILALVVVLALLVLLPLLSAAHLTLRLVTVRTVRHSKAQ